MPLTPPPDYTKAVLCAATGISIALIIGLWTRTTLPFAGDQAHSFPHGGFYQDGTKRASYNCPHKLNSIGHPAVSREVIFLVVLALSGCIAFRTLGQSRCCQCCGRRHA
ncbi:triple gene block 2 protein [Hippeastrum latent virus]|uniref:Movement protein TGB2 n=1 Tax=Hippeastrum latent virus TaxID=335963 RepID=Q4F976_9VIRU|nr:triple gene block 2 protein [Hippeastrum latent virus]AAZ15108.1 triple gene block 2 protein [Hippeastrum latent virus]